MSQLMGEWVWMGSLLMLIVYPWLSLANSHLLIDSLRMETTKKLNTITMKKKNKGKILRNALSCLMEIKSKVLDFLSKYLFNCLVIRMVGFK